MDGFILDGGFCSYEAAGVTTFGGGPASCKFLASGIGGFNACDVFSTGGNTGSGNLTSKVPPSMGCGTDLSLGELLADLLAMMDSKDPGFGSTLAGIGLSISCPEGLGGFCS